MAPVLQCPDCGRKHPLEVADGRATFPCANCGRPLKVPPEFLAGAATVPATPNGQQPEAPQPSPPQPSPRRAARRERAMDGEVPRTVRLVLWLIALPLGFVLVFGLAHEFGLLTVADIEHVYLDTGWRQYWPILRLVPLVAIVVALLVQLGELACSRLRIWGAERRTPQPLADAPTIAPREPARPAS